MSNDLLIIKVANDHLFTYFKADGDYSDVAAKVLFFMDRYHGGATAESCALCDVAAFKAALALPKGFRTGVDDPGDPITCDFRLMLKSAVTTETIIPPDGVTIEEIDAGDTVVCHV